MHGSHERRNLRQSRGDCRPDVASGEESRPLDVAGATDVGAVDVDHLDRSDAEAGTVEHVELDRDVVEVDVFHVRAGLDLAEPPGAVAEALEDVDTHADPVVDERRLEDGGHRRVAEERLRAGDGLIVRGVVAGREDAAGKERMRAPRDLGAAREDRDGERIGPGGELGAVTGEPQPLQALPAREVLRLAEQSSSFVHRRIRRR